MAIVVLDIGGTFVKSGYFERGELHVGPEFPSKAELGAKILLERCLFFLKSEFAAKGVKMDALGISTRGQVDTEQGKIIYAHDILPSYSGCDVRSYFSERLGIPVYVENDVNAAAYGELMRGSISERENKSFLCLTIGTGVGGAIIEKGKIRRGRSFQAAEFGAMITHAEARKPGDRLSGSYERYASTKALVARCRAADPGVRSARNVVRFLSRRPVRQAADRWAFEVALGLANLCHLLNPDTIILGGGLMEQEVFLKMIRAHFKTLLLPGFGKVEILQAKLGNAAGLMGVAYLTQEYLQKLARKA